MKKDSASVVRIHEEFRPSDKEKDVYKLHNAYYCSFSVTTIVIKFVVEWKVNPNKARCLMRQSRMYQKICIVLFVSCKAQDELEDKNVGQVLFPVRKLKVCLKEVLVELPLIVVPRRRLLLFGRNWFSVLDVTLQTYPVVVLKNTQKYSMMTGYQSKIVSNQGPRS